MPREPASSLGVYVMRLVGLAISAAFALQLVPLAAAAQPLSANGPWTLANDPESCGLRREFGSGDNLASVELRRFYPGDQQIVVTSSNLRVTRSSAMRYRFSDEDEWHEYMIKLPIETSRGSSGVVFYPTLFTVPGLEEVKSGPERNALLARFDLPSLESEAAAKVGTLTLLDAFDEEIALEVGSLAEPLALINDCIDEQMSRWNIDVEADKTLSRRVALVSIQTQDFPPLAWLFADQAPSAVSIRLNISERGRVENCHFYRVAGDPGAARASCAKLRGQLRFEPALDKHGNPIASYYAYRMFFPGPDVTPPKP
jgi:hypothetical protein